jgi:hypothetical protein
VEDKLAVVNANGERTLAEFAMGTGCPLGYLDARSTRWTL